MPRRSQVDGQVMDLRALRGRVWELSCRAGRCRDVQQTLEVADPATAGGLACELRGLVWNAMQCPHANHVLQKCITVLQPVPHWLVEEVLSWGSQGIETMAKHRFGCRVFERLLEHCEEGHKQQLVASLLEDVVSLSQEEFANYCIQFILEHSNSEQRSEVINLVIAEAAWLATHYYAGAVVTKALQHGSAEQRLELAETLLAQGPWLLERMAVHRFSNEAVIEMLGLPQATERVRGILRPNWWQLQASRYGREILQFL